MSAFWHFIECIGKALIQVLSLTDVLPTNNHMKNVAGIGLVNWVCVFETEYCKTLNFCKHF